MFKRYWWILVVMLPIGMLAGFMVSSVITYVMPVKYESSASIEVKLADGDGLPEIKNRDLLMGVVDSLDLTNRWEIDRESALGILQKMVRKENIRGTDLHVITVRHTNREDARDIAAEVAKAYVNSKNVTASDKVEGKLSELRKAVREQEEKVREARNTLTELSRTMDLSKEMDATEAQSYTEAKRDFETALALLEQMELKLLSSTIDAQLREGTIVIHDYPVISHVPVSPNVTLNLVIGAVGGLLISPFLALPLMWVLSRGDATRG